MRVARCETHDAALAKAGDKPIDEIGNLISLACRRIEIALRGLQGIACHDRQADEIEAEARIERIGERIEPFAIETQHGGGIEARAAKLHADAPHRTIGTEKAHLEGSPPFAAPLQHAHRLGDKAGKRRLDILGSSDRLGETTFDDAIRHGPARHDARILLARNAPQPRQQLLAEAGRKRQARPLQQVPDGLEAGAGKRGCGLMGNGERRDKERRNGLRFGTRRHDRHAPEPCKRLRRIGRAGGRGACGKPRPRHAMQHVSAQSRLPAEEMRAAGNIEDQAIRRIERHERRPAVAIIGDGLEQRRIGGRIGIEHGDLRHSGTRIRERQAYSEAKCDGFLVERGKTHRALDLFGDDDRLIRRSCGAECPPPPQPVDRQERKEEGEIAA